MNTNTNPMKTHQTEMELWFAELGLAVTEVERCPEPTCELCREAAPMRIVESEPALAA
ncbi:MAG: hypothetical protein KJP12_07235 [Acidimicrobiia bacterium]|nr:hypothetical protein [Acidimicrobiia bacterium]MBT8215003.1 hypothetical protein [Acidimicrobiia bacterium]NNF69189.1 hypothetical protein [Acidimicrobiia bacterium]NNK91477.1 hypothetical protein [Acidimicrobiia bacterium]